VRAHLRGIPGDGCQAANALREVRQEEGPPRAHKAAGHSQQLQPDAPAKEPKERHRTKGSLMQFRRKRLRGQNQKVRRTWLSEDGYRIVWRKEVYGVRVPARFQACVRTILPNGWQMWDFVNHHRRLMKTAKAAQEECEKHKRLWTKACEATGIRQLRELFGGKLPLGVPVWVKKKINGKLYIVLMDDRPTKHRNDEDEPCENSGDQPEASETPPTSDTDSDATKVVPASPAAGADGATIRRPRRRRLKGTRTRDECGTPPATDRKKRSCKRTATSMTSTNGSSGSARKGSRSPRKTKSARSGS